MSKLLIAAATAATLLSSPALAVDANDYMDKDIYSCNKKEIEDEISTMYREGPPATRGERVIYVKGDPVEITRKLSLLRCKVTIVTNLTTRSGIFEFTLEDGHALAGWQEVKSKSK